MQPVLSVLRRLGFLLDKGIRSREDVTVLLST